MRLLIELTLDEYMVPRDDEERRWFEEDVLGDEKLFLHLNEIGDTVGMVKVLEVDGRPLVEDTHE